MNHPPHPKRPSKPPAQHGLTLMEVLLASVIGIVVILLLVSFLPKATRTSLTTVADTATTVRINKIIETLQQQFKNKSFAGFTQANSSTLTAVFLNGVPASVPTTQEGGYLNDLKTVRISGLGEQAVGTQVMIASDDGTAKILTVTATPSSGTYTFNCTTGMPSNVPVNAWPVTTMTLTISGGQLTRMEGDSTTPLAPIGDTRFGYVYESAGGELIRDPEQAGANLTPAGRLVGLLPVTQDTGSGIDRSALIPLAGSKVKRILACGETAAITPNEGRLNVTILGLPPGATPDVTLGGPDPSVSGQHPTTSRTYQPVQRGTYTMTAGPVTYAGHTYKPIITGSPATLHNSWGDTYLQVRYAEQTGTLRIKTSGLPSSSAPMTTKQTSTGDMQTFLLPYNGTATLTVAVGRTTIEAGNVNIAGVTYKPNPASTWADLMDGQTVDYVINYSPVNATGTLIMNVSGLPGGTGPTIGWTGPTPGNVTGSNASFNVANLQPGSYVITPTNALSGTSTYKAPSQTVSISGGNTTTINVIYTTSTPPTGGTGTIVLTIQGVTVANNTNLLLNGPQPVSLPISNATYTMQNMPTGTYYATVPGISTGTTSQTPTPASINSTLSAGGTLNITVTYSGGTGGAPPEPPAAEKCDAAVRCMGEAGDGAVLGSAITIGKSAFPVGTSLDTDMGNGQTLRDFLMSNNPTSGDVAGMLQGVPNWAVGLSGTDAALGKDVPLTDPTTATDPSTEPTPTPSPDPTPAPDPSPAPDPTPAPSPDPNEPPPPPPPFCSGNSCIDPNG